MTVKMSRMLLQLSKYLSFGTALFAISCPVIALAEVCPDLPGYEYSKRNERYPYKAPVGAVKRIWKIPIADSTNINTVNLARTYDSLMSRGYLNNNTPSYICKIALQRVGGGSNNGGYDLEVWYCEESGTGRMFVHTNYPGGATELYPDKNGNIFGLTSKNGDRFFFYNTGSDICTSKIASEGAILKVSTDEGGPLLPFLLLELVRYPLYEIRQAKPKPSF